MVVQWIPALVPSYRGGDNGVDENDVYELSRRDSPIFDKVCWARDEDPTCGFSRLGSHTCPHTGNYARSAQSSRVCAATSDIRIGR